MSPAEVHGYVCSAFDDFVRRRSEGIGPQHWGPLRASLLTWVREIDQDVAFAGLLSVLESERRFQYQDIAGELLDKAGIACSLSLEDFMRKVLPLWNLSAVTVPRYAARVFGREKVLCLIHALKTSGVTWPGPGTLEAMSYHLGTELPTSEDRSLRR